MAAAPDKEGTPQNGLTSGELYSALHLPVIKMVNSTPLSVMIGDASGKVIWMNKASEELTGYTLAEFAGKKPSQLLHGKATNPATVEYIRNQFSEKKTVQCEIVNYTKKQEEHWIQLNITPILDKTNSVEYYVAIQKDISKRKVLEELVVSQLGELRDSLEYGKRIQLAVLPDPNALPPGLNEWMVVYQPKDTLSGDFYWVESRDGHLFLVVADGTGHGAPGALMATMGVSLLNQALLHATTFRTDAILSNLHNRLVKTLNKTRSSAIVNDTIDIAMVRISAVTKQIEFSGARRPLIVAGPGGITVHEGTKLSIGETRIVVENPFSSINVSVGPEDTVYMFTDGVTDQFNDEGKKLTKAHILSFIKEHYHLPLFRQKEFLEQFLTTWQGLQPQLDDRLLIAFRL